MTEMHKKIRFARRAANLSQSEVGNACQPPISKAAVGQWESENQEKRTAPSRNNLLTLSQLTGFPIEFFLDNSINLSAEDEKGIRDEQGQYMTDKPENKKTLIQDAILKLLTGHLAKHYNSLPIEGKIPVVLHLNELLQNAKLRDSITTLDKQTLFKLLKIED